MTIAAISSPSGPGLRGVIRVSGPAARALVEACSDLEPRARGVYRGRFRDGRGEQPLLLLWMPGPHSYTREDVAELHLPGAAPLLDAALERLVQQGARLAGAGEFTRRAFTNGRLDLTRAEGVLSLIEASNEDERRSASALLLGGLAGRVGELRDGLEELRALCEASLDFDESDTGHVAEEELLRLGSASLEALRAALRWEERREPLSGLPRVALVGAPNAGKSSLFNRLASGGGRALVSELAGTTRDGVAAVWRVGHVDCRLVDAPGLDAAPDLEPDRVAQELARGLFEESDLLLWIVDASRADGGWRTGGGELPQGPARILVWNKIDLDGAAATPDGAVEVSARTGSGLVQLAARAAEALGLADPRAASGTSGAAAAGGVGRELSVRHRHALEAALRELALALERLAAGAPLDLVAEGLRGATDALDDVSGRTTPEDLLDRIFARFCLGK